MGPKNKQITGNIWQVGGSGLTAPDDAAAYLIAFRGAAALVDAGCGNAIDMLLANIESTGTPLDQVGLLLLTHCHYDHSGGAAEIRRRLGCRTAAHALDAEWIESGDDQITAAGWYGQPMDPCPVDVRLAGGERLIIGDGCVEVIAIPGHSPGSVAYRVDSAGKDVLFAQDVHGPLHPDLRSNRTDYQASLRRLLNLRADILCEGHYGVFTGKEAVAAFVRSFLAS
ncbi:MAG TPA: MBL fold metallo-hydrolase [Rhodocyclaceae bacterium]|nr:MBL fold metallo-hydrolase [Rhodocyclaceae bacterium]HNH35420.1 MBL fold metallo-hydrolase [Rhodocyclaceae bacterium]HNO35770.1 MBL fold metallo-hydrolase [Nitrospira sp.]